MAGEWNGQVQSKLVGGIYADRVREDKSDKHLENSQPLATVRWSGIPTNDIDRLEPQLEMADRGFGAGDSVGPSPAPMRKGVPTTEDIEMYAQNMEIFPGNQSWETDDRREERCRSIQEEDTAGGSIQYDDTDNTLPKSEAAKSRREELRGLLAKTIALINPRVHQRQRTFTALPKPTPLEGRKMRHPSRAISTDSFFKTISKWPPLIICGKEKRECPQIPSPLHRYTLSGEIQSFSYLQKISLEGRYVVEENPDEKIQSLLNILGYNAYVRELNLSCNMISDLGAKYISKFITGNSTLLELNLSRNWKITDEGGVAIANALCTNKTLQNLSLMSCKNIGIQAANAFSRTLLFNSSLEALNLGDTAIGSEGVTVIADALCQNSTLKSIDLSQTALGADGVRAISRTLRHNSSLSHIYLKNDDISNSEAVVLAEGAEENRTLAKLDLGNNYVSVEILKRIDGYLKNKKIPQEADAVSEGREIMRQAINSETKSLLLPLEYIQYCTSFFSDERLLGEGDFGEVFLGIDKAIRRKFAVKRQKFSIFVNKQEMIEARETFLRELEASITFYLIFLLDGVRSFF